MQFIHLSLALHKQEEGILQSQTTTVSIHMYYLIKAPLRRDEDVVERLIRHEAQPSALLGLETRVQ